MPEILDYRTIGTGAQQWRVHDSGDGDPIVMFHGFPDSPDAYEPLLAGLHAAGYRTVLPYLRGYHA